MKKLLCCLTAGVMLAIGAVTFAACGTTTITTTPNQGVSAYVSENVKSYDDTAFYELENPSDVSFGFDTEKVQKISYMYRTLSSGDWSLKNGTITIKQSVFDGETAGEKRIRVFVDGSYVQIALRVVTKVIYTTEDFNSIRDNLNGVYVLGADIDFGNEPFWPIGKAVSASDSTATFEGIFDGRGHAVKNITINAYDKGVGEDSSGQGPSLGAEVANPRNYNNGIFAQTSANAQILNTDFVNITVNSQGLSGAVVGANGGLIKNCRISCTLNSDGEAEHSGGIAGMNGSGDAAGKIENCIVLYTVGSSKGTPRGIADWNVGSITNCYAAPTDDYVFYPDYDAATGGHAEGFDYNTYLETHDWNSWIWYSYYTLPAFPGTVDTSTGTYYPGGTITNSDVVRKEFLLDPDNFPEEDGWDRSVWNFSYGTYPTLIVLDR